MNEHLTTNLPAETEAIQERSGSTCPASERISPDWRRLEVASRRFGELIAAGIQTAMEQRTEIDQGTARCISHVLGRAFGRQSALAGFGRTGEGSFEALRDEYLTLYHDSNAAASTVELIGWLGTHLVQREHHGTARHFGNEHLPPKLERLLVPTTVTVGAAPFTVHVPASYGTAAITDLSEALHELQLGKDQALQAFLSLPDVNAMSGDIMEGFHENYVGTFISVEDALHEMAEVDERERDLLEYAAERRLVIEHVSADYEALREEIADGYDIVEREGRAYVFYK